MITYYTYRTSYTYHVRCYTYYTYYVSYYTYIIPIMYAIETIITKGHFQGLGIAQVPYGTQKVSRILHPRWAQSLGSGAADKADSILTLQISLYALI